MEITRRGFIKGATAVSLVAMAPNLTGCGDEDGTSGPKFEPKVFLHGVASGDPLADCVIIWTRVTSVEEREQGGRPLGTPDVGPIEVEWQVATDKRMRNIVAGDVFTTDASRDYTVKIDVQGLEPGTTYYYQFRALDEESQVGRTRTTPVGDVSNVRMAIASCSSLSHGYFNAYRVLAERNDIDVVVHLGDYIYEYASDSYGKLRPYDPPHEIITLEDYRRRHAQYKEDADLQAVHQQHPFVCVWDDHEVANNTWKEGAGNHSESEGDFNERVTAAHLAYSNWMPIRDQDNLSRIYRKFTYGNLMDLIMLDTRYWGRDKQGEEDTEDRTLLGFDQEEWLAEQLSESQATWKFLGQQIMVAQLSLDNGVTPLNDDQWDGYAASRDRLYNQIESTPGGNVVVLTGDIHTAFAADITRDPFTVGGPYTPATGEGSIAVEFVCTSITSPGLEGVGALPNAVTLFKNLCPHIKFVDFDRKGFTVIDISHDRVQADYVGIETVKVPDVTNHQILASLTCEAGSNRLTQAEGPLSSRSGQPDFAPVR